MIYCLSLGEFSKSYPNATSSHIMIANPIIAPMVERSVSFPVCDSGINSSTTTKIIAPAANDKAYGSSGVTEITR